MKAKAKKALGKNLKKKLALASSSPAQLSNEKSTTTATAADFLPLEGGRKLSAKQKGENSNNKNKATVLYMGRIPHGFYEKEMQDYFSQFGNIKRLRIARNKKTGKSKHYGFIEFEDPEVAEVVADCMHNYLLFEHLLQVHLIPPEHVHPKLWRGFDYRYTPFDWVQVEQKRLNKDRTLEEHKKLVEKIMKRDKKRQKKIDAAGLDYECPEMVGDVMPAPKRIKFDED
ncbi:uncharacterized RNA-binding protein C1827.05c [Mercurialis annua]|uniref:uncharacterized RNA-binding protein C1827.05c n=1 Tax=Mercurialis annua TaxID=3986 RepID=UPI00215E4B96|nr:uncharacterized RNA-binding protein C1827.05c [Mercurialis annua]XP_050211134.1 uncharacterized RNA-binding protein C1827.05c [Mercurialis annua]